MHTMENTVYGMMTISDCSHSSTGHMSEWPMQCSIGSVNHIIISIRITKKLISILKSLR